MSVAGDEAGGSRGADVERRRSEEAAPFERVRDASIRWPDRHSAWYYGGLRAVPRSNSPASGSLQFWGTTSDVTMTSPSRHGTLGWPPFRAQIPAVCLPLRKRGADE